MKEWLPLLITSGLVLGGLAAFCWGVISGFRTRSKIATDKVDKAQSDLIEVIRMEAEAWKTRYESEHEEFSDYRTQTHQHNNDCNDALLKLTADNAELRSKTDLSPVLKFQTELSAINLKVAKSLDMIIKHLEVDNGK